MLNGIEIIISNEFNLGKGASIKKGIDFASNQNIILIDGDLEVEIDDITGIQKKIVSTSADGPELLSKLISF